MKIKNILLIVTSVIALSRINLARAQDVSTSSDEIRKKVQEKIAQVSQNPKGYVGTITDISTSTIQARKFIFGKETQKTTDIIQIKTSDTTKIIDNKDSAKTIKFQDLAIGDFAIFMGKSINGGTLDASRIVVIKPIEKTKRVNMKLKITKAEKQKITASVNNISYTINISKNTKLLNEKGEKTETKNLGEGTTIIVCGEKDGNSIEARTIFVIEN